MPEKIEKRAISPKVKTKIIGKILFLQSTIHALPNDKVLAEFLCRGLEDLPHVHMIAVNLEGYLKSSDPTLKPEIFSNIYGKTCDKAAELGKIAGLQKSELFDEDSLCVHIQTSRFRYGCFLIVSKNMVEFMPYLPFIESLANTTALNIENRKNTDTLKQLNEDLRGHKKKLESKVIKHTEDLRNRNQELKIEIRERKQAREDLQESETRFRTITEHSPDAIFLTDQQGNYTYVNQAACDLLGYSHEELTEMHISDIAEISKIDAGRNQFQEILQRGRLFTETTLARKDGTVIPVDLNTVVLPNGSVYGSCRNLTKRKQAEEVLIQLNKDQASLLEISKLLTSSLDMKTLLQNVIDQSVSLCDLDTGAIYLVQGDELFIGAASPPIPADFPEVFRHTTIVEHPNIENALSARKPHVLPDLAVADLSPAEEAIRDSRNMRSLIYVPLTIKGQAVGVLILGTVTETRSFTVHELNLYLTLSNQAALAIENARLFEVTQHNVLELEKTILERKQAEKALGASEDRFRQLFEQSPYSIQILSPDGFTKLVNPAWEKISGIPADALKGYNMLEDNQLIEKRLMPYVLKGFAGEITDVPAVEYNPVEAEALKATRMVQGWEKRYLAARFFPIFQESGEIHEIVLTHEDVSERMNAEERLLESEEMYRMLFNGSAVGIIISQGNDIVSANKACTDIFGYDNLEDYLRIPLMDQVAPESKAMILERNKKKQLGEFLEPRYEYKIIRKDKEIRDIEITTVEIIIRDEKYIQGSFHDITERKKAEHAIAQLAATLEAAQEMVK
ncbi:MAG: PAS domain S-box protein, partial [Candidatus Marinimicrobia bacterium]|nr:PAS domain S-box protein [Candidatus Neomarinimicrobiota bacterium]